MKGNESLQQRLQEALDAKEAALNTPANPPEVAAGGAKKGSKDAS